jgi:FlaA1/EpsC-like NDP-sugar epimerase
MEVDALNRLTDQLVGVMIRLSRRGKRGLLVLNDFAIMLVAVWLSMSLRLSTFYVPTTPSLALMLLLAPIIGIGVFAWFGPYRLVTRFIGGRGTLRIAGAVGISIVLWSLAIFLSGISYQGDVIPRSIIPLYGILAFSGIVASRQIAAWLLRGTHRLLGGSDPERRERRRVIIWGAGQPGVNLLTAMRTGSEYEPIGFIDDSENLWGQDIGGLKVYRPTKLDRLIERESVKEVVLTITNQRRSERQEIVRQLAALSVRVKTLPDVEDVVSGRVEVSDLRPLDVQDLLGREAVPPDPRLLGRDIRDRSVMVTGAGGSIGSELVRQIIRQSPRRLVLLDVSEAALYEIGIEVAEIVSKLTIKAGRSAPEIVSVLGSVADESLLAREILNNRVETIYHAAAYKHVPIVEHNPVMGLANNTFGTLTLAETARKLNVERVVLISTDKAVRPTNVMGASKRLAELIFQAAAASGSGTVFTMVRFGNVLDSSGSVVRLFRKQIEAGGPVTVTHRDIVRYFMSIPEAATLVLQAGAMAKGGEVFVLDMGEPVKIDELARSMIRLMGLDVQDDDNPDGDIAIRYTGLRPGEKLYEELWLGDDTTGTEHPRIMRKAEPALPAEILQRELDALRVAMAANNIEAIRAVLLRTVEGYRPGAEQLGRLPLEGIAPVSRTLH